MKLFETNEETKLLQLTAEARGIEVFNKLLKRVSKMPGDADGRKKLLNEKEILFAWFSSNHDSDLRYADDEERVTRLKVQLALPEGWKPDELVNDAIKFIKNDQYSLTGELLDEAVDTVKTLREYYKQLKQDIKANPQQYSKKPKLMSEIVQTFADLKIAIENLELLREKYTAEQSSKKTKKGRMMSRFETEDI